MVVWWFTNEPPNFVIYMQALTEQRSQTAKFKFPNINSSAFRNQTIKFNDHQYFRLYGTMYMYIPGMYM